MIPPTDTTTTIEQQHKDDEGDILMKEAEDKETNEKQEETEKINPELESEGQGGEDLTEKTVEEPVEGNLDDQTQEQDQGDQFHDTNMPSPPKEKSPSPEQPPIPEDSPPKDPSPPHSKSDKAQSSSS